MNRIVELNFSSIHPLSLSILGHLSACGLILILILPNWLGLMGSLLTRTQEVPLEVIEFPTAPPQLMTQAPRAVPKAQPQSRQVFGVTRQTMMDHSPDSTFEAKSGNTLAKTPDQKKLRPEDETSLPIPAEEYLVSQMPILLNDFRIPYPAEAKKKGVQGAVLFDLLVDAEGKVRQAVLVEGPDPTLIEAARMAVMRFIFKPALVESKPVAVKIRYRYRFQIEG